MDNSVGMAILKGMQKKGLIKFAPETGCLMAGAKQVINYIDDAPKYPFEYNGSKYTLKYFSGCFYPYVIQIS